MLNCKIYFPYFIWVVFIFLTTQSHSQKLDRFFKRSHHSYTLYELKRYYNEHYTNNILANRASKQNSDLLKKKNSEIYLMNELTRANLLSLNGDNKNALSLLYSLKKNPNFKKSKKLFGYYFNVFGGILFSANKPNEARYNYKKALILLTSARDSVGMKGNYINIANTFNAIQNFDSAAFYYQKAIELEKLGCEEFDYELQINLSILYMSTMKYKEAIEIQQSLLKKMENRNNFYGEIVITLNLVYSYIHQKKYSTAIELLNTCQKIAEEHHFKQYFGTISKHLSECYEAEGNLIKAQKYLHIAYKYNNSLNDIKFGEYAEKLKNQYQTELFEKEKKIKDQQIEKVKSNQLNLIIAFGFVLFFLIFLIIFNRKIDLKNKLLVLKNLELTESISLNKKKKSESKIIIPELIEQIENLFDKDKIFMDPELTLDKISKLLNTNRSYLSETINQHYNKSFRTIINTYRINEARLLLVDEKFHHYSIEGIALTVGYKSISSFNSVFKKETGITPSYFRNTYLEMKKNNI